MSRSPPATPWLPYGPSRAGASRLLFCLPYAGGAASAYREWVSLAGPDWDVRPVQLPGRETRIADPPSVDVGELATAIANHVDRPYAIFGHSMGGRLGFELIRELRRRKVPMPQLFFVSGVRPPEMEIVTRISHLPDDEFCARVVAMGGTQPEALAEPELRELVLPALRADFTAVESYAYADEPPLPVPIVGFAGADDPEASPEDMIGWAAHTGRRFTLHTLPGSHFFLHSARPAVQALIDAEAAAVGGPSPYAPIAADEVVVIDVRLDEWPDLGAALAELSPTEAGRAAAIRRPDHATRHIARCAALRRVLEAYGADVGVTEFTRGPRGKPQLPAAGLRFNAAHSDGIALIALSTAHDIGIDVERRTPMRDLQAFLDGALDPAETRELAELDPERQLEAALAVWTAKEAVLKATGDGLGVEPAAFGYAGQLGATVWRPRADPGLERLRGWAVRHLRVPGALAAVATREATLRLRYHRLLAGDLTTARLDADPHDCDSLTS